MQYETLWIRVKITRLLRTKVKNWKFWCKQAGANRLHRGFWGRYGGIFSYGEFFGILRSQYLVILCYSQLAQYSFLCLTHKEVSLAAGCFHYSLQEELPRPRVSFAFFVSHHRFVWPGGLPRFGKHFSQKTIFLGLSVKQNSWHRPLCFHGYVVQTSCT